MIDIETATTKFFEVIEPAKERALATGRAMNKEAIELKNKESEIRFSLAGHRDTPRWRFAMEATLADLQGVTPADLEKMLATSAPSGDFLAGELHTANADLQRLIRTIRNRMSLVDRRAAFDSAASAAIGLANNCRKFLEDKGAAL